MLGDKLLPGTKPGILKSEKMLGFKLLYIHKSVLESRTTQQNNNPRPYITVPYYRGLSESIKQRCKNYGVQVYFRGGKTIKNLLMAPKDLDPMMKKSGVIYSYKCGRVECDEEYIGES